MSEDKPSLHIDLDWKKQAQEEKRRLEEEEKKRAEEQARQASVPMGGMASVTAPAAAAPGAPAASAQAPSAAAARGQRRGREIPPASFPTLVQSLVTQTLFYLGDLSSGGEMNMDMAKHQLDTLGMLEEKTQGNLSPDEQQVLDLSLYETRMRFISVAGQIIAGA